MSKRIISLIITVAMMVSMLSAIPVSAAVEDEDDIPEKIALVKDVYEPGKSYFVSNSTMKWVGEDNIDGDKTLECFAPSTTNSHGRFGGLWQSMGFANYVFYNTFGEMPQFGYHCNPNELNNKIEVIGRYASNCRYIRGKIDGDISVSNLKQLLSNAKQGDILVVAPEKNCNRTGRAMIVMSVNENYLTVYHADYKGNCAVTEDTIAIDALADFHCVSLLRSTDYPYPQPVPPNVVEKVTLSNTDFSLNENVSITWPLVKYAQNYKVYLVDENDNPVQQGEYKSSVTSFVFKKAGTYRVKVVAANEYGDSDASYSEAITVHNQNVVTFLDYDGTIITTQKVEYGKNATAPNVPQRKGYQFAGWDKSLENITEPTEITATYEVETYTIKYYDVGGKNVLSAETVEYQGQANPPTNYTITDGYVFSGWQISFDSEGTDYNCVDGDMTLIATQKWANLNLPITITVSDAHRDSTATYYSADLKLTNHDDVNAKNFKIVGTLKAADGKALKIVVLDEVSLNANESKTLSDRTIVYSEKATTIEFTAVGMVGNSKTGGAFSKTASSSIVDNSSWGSWSDWTTSNQISSYDDYETKTQYRYRNKAYTTSTSSSLSGWTKYNTTSSVGGWSSWSTSYVSGFQNDAQLREVQTNWVAPTYKTQYHYFTYYKGSSAPWTHYSSSHPYFAEIWVDSQLPFYKYSGGINQYGGSGYNFGYSFNRWLICDGTTYGGPGPWTRQVQTGGGYTQYRYRDTYYTYYFWKWGDWSSWSDTYRSGDGTETRTLYRYRNRSESGDVEDTSGEFFDISGTLNNVESDFSGMTASIMVYKRCNTDPTEEQLEYIGQTTIGENNSYSFNFKPREMPSSETGEFIVALGIEGADRLVNVDVIEADVPTYQVKFVADGVMIDDENAEDITDSDGNTFRAQLVKEGESAIAPEPPEKEGYTFVKWSETLTGIETDKVITAEYQPNEYSLVFIDWDTNKVTTQKMKYGDTIVYPALDEVEGVSSRTWDKQLEGVEIVTDNMIIGSVSELNSYTVTFMNGEEVISTQTVKHGNKAEVPAEVPIIEAMTFAGWVGDCSTEYITQDVTFTPSYLYSKTVSMPEANVVSKAEDGSSTIELTCDTEGAEIYYIIETHDEATLMDTHDEIEGGICTCEDAIHLMEDAEIIIPEADFRAIAQPYTGEITLASNETITFIAFAEGMNESIPGCESNEGEYSYYDVEVTTNTLRQYKNSVEGSLIVNIINEMPEYEYGTVTLCFYDDRGILIDIMPKSIEVVPGENTVEFDNIELTGTLVKNADSITCKIVSWLSGEKITPISDLVEFKLN